jgi:5-methylcytosine-specific restriction endonuclease McrA
VRREREKARELRRSQWWKNRIATGICHYCGCQVEPKALTLDHVVPIIRGGRSTRGNCVPCCKECNNQKKHLLPVEWQSYLDRLGKKTPD